MALGGLLFQLAQVCDWDAIEPYRSLALEVGFERLSLHVVDARVQHEATATARGLVEGNPGVRDTHRRANAAPETITQAVADAIRETYGSDRPTFALREIVFEAQAPREAA